MGEQYGRMPLHPPQKKQLYNLTHIHVDTLRALHLKIDEMRMYYDCVLSGNLCG